MTRWCPMWSWLWHFLRVVTLDWAFSHLCNKYIFTFHGGVTGCHGLGLPWGFHLQEVSVERGGFGWNRERIGSIDRRTECQEASLHTAFHTSTWQLVLFHSSVEFWGGSISHLSLFIGRHFPLRQMFLPPPWLPMCVLWCCGVEESLSLAEQDY